MEKLQTINECPEFFKVGPLAQYRLPEIYTPENVAYTHAVVYDGSSLRKDINKQRGPLGSGSIDPVLVMDLQAKFHMTRPRDIFTKNLISVESFPDYLEIDDNLSLRIFTDCNEQLSQDLFDYFKEKITFVYLHESDKEKVKNISEKTLSAVKQTLPLVEGQGVVAPSLYSQSPDVFDVLFSDHPGIENQIRFSATEDLKNPQKLKHCNSLERYFPFLDIAGKRYLKTLFFCGAFPTKGSINLRCDIGTQLDLLEYLKGRGHAVALTLSQSGILKDEVRYRLFAI